MIGDDQQARRIGEFVVLGIPARLGMPVRRDQRQVLDAGIKRLRDAAGLGFGIEQPVVVKQSHGRKVLPNHLVT